MEPLQLQDMKAIERKLYLKLVMKGHLHLEGSASPEELLYLYETARREGARLIGEIGFNAGFSSYALLATHPEARVVSFDIGDHGYVGDAKALIDREFPGRHELVFGDSRETLPRFADERPERFDFFFIDGGHDYEVASADIRNARSVCREGAAIVMDDLVPWLPWGAGPTRAWEEALAAGAIRQEELVQDGMRVEKVTEPAGRAWALGRFNGSAG